MEVDEEGILQGLTELAQVELSGGFCRFWFGFWFWVFLSGGGLGSFYGVGTWKLDEVVFFWWD